MNTSTWETTCTILTGGLSLAFGSNVAFAVSSYTIEEIATLGGDESIALGINDLGDVAGRAHLTSGEFRAYKFVGGATIDLGTLGVSFLVVGRKFWLTILAHAHMGSILMAQWHLAANQVVTE